MTITDIIEASSGRKAARQGGGKLKIYARHGARIRIVSDDTAVRDADLVHVAPFESAAEAEAVARACADFLTLSISMAPDAHGWHAIPDAARLDAVIATMLQAAKTAVWSRPEEAEAESIAVPIEAEIALPRSMRQCWTLRRVAWFGFLVGLGWTAKRIATDELIRSTPENVWRQAHRFGLSLAAAPQGQVCVDLPIATLAVIDKAAAASHLQRDAFVKRLLIRAAKDPSRYGLVVV